MPRRKGSRASIDTERREREIMAEAAKTKETITLEEARRVIDAAERKAEEIGYIDDERLPKQGPFGHRRL
jgi:hypothetical protein